ncbi:MAG: hypothetical protein Tsb0014_15430 [Pleurocapsa sp.]
MNYTTGKQDKVMTCEQFSQVVEAILSGKYSWACVLILRFAGYNPLHYIPYRTYNRLIKTNRLENRSVQANKNPVKSDSSRRLKDLSYLEELKTASARVHGGQKVSWLGIHLGLS